MSELREQLRTRDPLRDEPALSATDAARMRRVVLDAAQPPAMRWPSVLVTVAGGLSLLAAGAAWTARTQIVPATSSMTGSAGPATDTLQVERRQLQFSTPGGTRVIWVLDKTAN